MFAEAAHEGRDSGKVTAGGFQEDSLSLSPKALRCYPYPSELHQIPSQGQRVSINCSEKQLSLEPSLQDSNKVMKMQLYTQMAPPRCHPHTPLGTEVLASLMPGPHSPLDNTSGRHRMNSRQSENSEQIPAMRLWVHCTSRV